MSDSPNQRVVQPRHQVRRCVRWTGYNADEVTEFLGTPAWGITASNTPVQPGWWLYKDGAGTVGAMSSKLIDSDFEPVTVD